MKKQIITLAILAATQNVYAERTLSIPLNGGNGQLEGVITNEDKFRITHIHDNGPRDFKISGDFFKGLTLENIQARCKGAISVYPEVYLKNEKSLYVSAVIYPYGQKEISTLVGLEAETYPSISFFDASLKLQERSSSLRVMRWNERYSTQFLKIAKFDQNKAVRGEEVTLDLTSQVPVFCDLMNGTAELTFNVQVTFPQLAPTVFKPLSASELESLSKKYRANYTWSQDPVDNLIMAAVSFEGEVNSLRPITINKSSGNAQEPNWNRGTVSKVIKALFDKKIQPKRLTRGEAEALEKSLTVVKYDIEGRSLVVTPRWKVE